MKPHKWAKEIKAWADGAEIEMRMLNKEDNTWYEWENMSDILRFSNDYWWEYRIKPQPKEPQYLYVYKNVDGLAIIFTEWQHESGYIGKIKLIEDEND